MVSAGGTRTCVHPHVSCPIYHCATDADTYPFARGVRVKFCFMTPHLSKDIRELHTTSPDQIPGHT